jgi:hypothetical protein
MADNSVVLNSISGNNEVEEEEEDEEVALSI